MSREQNIFNSIINDLSSMDESEGLLSNNSNIPKIIEAQTFRELHTLKATYSTGNDPNYYYDDNLNTEIYSFMRSAIDQIKDTVETITKVSKIKQIIVDDVDFI